MNLNFCYFLNRNNLVFKNDFDDNYLVRKTISKLNKFQKVVEKSFLSDTILVLARK